jgi:pimeloyl-ACP methyl ester carboxylesterase
MSQKSTIVRKITRHALTMTLHSLEQLDPAWSSALAERLWFRAGKPPAQPVRNRHEVPSGTPFTVTHRIPTPPHREVPIRGTRWGDPDAPVAYLIHGWGGWWQQLGAFVPVLLDLGYQVVGFDALGHGDSGPGGFGRYSSSVPEMAHAYQAVVERFGTPAATVAHSIGCVTAAWAAHHHGIAPGRQVQIAPAATSRGMLETFIRTLDLGARTRAGLLDRFHARIGHPLTDFDLLTLATAHQDPPAALIVHDRDDPVTASSESEDLAAHWPGSELLITEGLGHYRILRAPDTLAAVGAFLTVSRTGN